VRKFVTDFDTLHRDVSNRDICRCGHIISSHEGKLRECEVCICKEYIPTENLRYLEYCYEKASK
jgi:hypothetical protein